MFTLFKDSTFFVWDLDSYKYEQYNAEGKELQVAANYNGFVSLYNHNSIMVADLNKECQFQKIDKFWDSAIEKVDFI